MANQNPIPTSTNYSQTTTPQTPVFAHSTQTSPQQVLNRTKEQQQKTFLRLITHITELAEVGLVIYKKKNYKNTN